MLFTLTKLSFLTSTTTHCVTLDYVLLCKKHDERIFMDTTKFIRELRERAGMTRKEFSEYTKIPVRTLEDWEAGRRTPPEYVPRLISYQLKYDELVKGKEDANGEID